MRNRTPRRMNTALRGLGEISDDYVGDFQTVFDPLPAQINGGYTPLGVDAQWSAITEGQTTQDATVQAALLSRDPATRAAALNEAVAAGKISVSATIPDSAFTAADVGKLVKVGAAVYQTMALRNAAGQMQYRPVAVNQQTGPFGISPPMLLLAGLAAIIALT